MSSHNDSIVHRGLARPLWRGQALAMHPSARSPRSSRN
jgi:hypothetical protein